MPQLPLFNSGQSAESLAELLKQSQENVKIAQTQALEATKNVKLAQQEQFGAKEGDSVGTTLGALVGTAIFGKGKELTKAEEKQALYEEKLKTAQQFLAQQQIKYENKLKLDEVAREQDAGFLSIQNQFDRMVADGVDPNEAARQLSPQMNDMALNPKFRDAFFKGKGINMVGAKLGVQGGELVSIYQAADANNQPITFAPQRTLGLMSDNGIGALELKKNAQINTMNQQAIDKANLQMPFIQPQAQATLGKTQAEAVKAQKEAGLAGAQTEQMQGIERANQAVANAITQLTGTSIDPSQVEGMRNANAKPYEAIVKQLQEQSLPAQTALPQLQDVEKLFVEAVNSDDNLTGALEDFKTQTARIADSLGFKVDLDKLADKAEVKKVSLEMALQVLKGLGGSDTERELSEALKAGVETGKTETENLRLLQKAIREISARVQAPEAFLTTTRSDPALLVVGQRALKELRNPVKKDMSKGAKETPTQQPTFEGLDAELKRRGL